MKNGSNLVLVGVLLAALAVGCSNSPSRSSGSTDSTKPRTASIPHVLVQKENGGATGVYQQDLKIYPAVMIDGRPSPGEHEFTLISTASYKGKGPSCAPKSLTFTITHHISENVGWKFPPSTKAAVRIDGVSVPLNVYSQLPYEMPAMAKYMKDPEPAEALVVSPTCDMYRLLSKAKTASFQIGGASFDLDGAAIDNFREFAGDIGYK